MVKNSSTWLPRREALLQVESANRIVQILNTAAVGPARVQITEAMKRYEEDVLKEVTWQPWQPWTVASSKRYEPEVTGFPAPSREHARDFTDWCSGEIGVFKRFGLFGREAGRAASGVAK
jgi:hypothetical protein